MRSGSWAGRLVAVLAFLSLVVPTNVRAGNEERDEFYRSLHRNRGAVSTGEGPTALLVSGVMGPGSYDEFRAAVMRTTPELVVLDGPGGILGEALLIGEEIRRRKLNTMVGPNRSCASACAIAFLSGRVKYLGTGGAVGLHSASFADGRADPEATEIMAAYLRGIGVPNATLRRMARTAPNEIRWLTRAEQRAMGIKAVTEAP